MIKTCYTIMYMIIHKNMIKYDAYNVCMHHILSNYFIHSKLLYITTVLFISPQQWYPAKVFLSNQFLSPQDLLQQVSTHILPGFNNFIIHCRMYHSYHTCTTKPHYAMHFFEIKINNYTICIYGQLGTN